MIYEVCSYDQRIGIPNLIIGDSFYQYTRQIHVELATYFGRKLAFHTSQLVRILVTAFVTNLWLVLYCRDDRQVKVGRRQHFIGVNYRPTIDRRKPVNVRYQESRHFLSSGIMLFKYRVYQNY